MCHLLPLDFRRSSDDLTEPIILSYHLVGKQQDRFQTELAGAKVEQVLQTGAQQLHHHDVVVTFGATPLNRWDSHCLEKRRRLENRTVITQG